MDAGFYRKNYRWFCPCEKRAVTCNNSVCKSIGIENNIKVGTGLCEHGRRRPLCRECGGKGICEHGRIRFRCKECGGKSICEHGRIRSTCKYCGGGEVCEHGRLRSQCKQCRGSSICEHDRMRPTCKECNGSQICQHNKKRNTCKECDPHGYISSLRRIRRNQVLKSKKNSHTLDDLGMTFGEWVQYLNTTFENRYGRSIQDNDDVHIDEIIPCSAWELPDENKYCWHYLNSQFLLAEDNLSKGTKYREEDKRDMIQKIDLFFSDCF